MTDAYVPSTPADCDYYRGVGTCTGGMSCGYYGEPRCVTDEPREGWASVFAFTPRDTTLPTAWPAPDLSPEERAIVDRFEAAPDPFLLDPFCYQHSPLKPCKHGVRWRDWCQACEDELNGCSCPPGGDS